MAQGSLYDIPKGNLVEHFSHPRRKRTNKDEPCLSCPKDLETKGLPGGTFSQSGPTWRKPKGQRVASLWTTEPYDASDSNTRAVPLPTSPSQQKPKSIAGLLRACFAPQRVPPAKGKPRGCNVNRVSCWRKALKRC